MYTYDQMNMGYINEAIKCITKRCAIFTFSANAMLRFLRNCKTLLPSRFNGI
jgi:hypothetical protein